MANTVTVKRHRSESETIFLTSGSGSGIGKKSGSGIRIRDEQPGAYIRDLGNNFWVKILKVFDADPGSGMDKIRIRDLGWKKFGSGIRD